MTLRVVGIQEESIVDGPGYRLAVFTQGCPHICPGCHNPQTHPIDGGYEVSIDDILEKLSSPLHCGITLTGGEPFLQPRACAELASRARAAGYGVWLYTGWTWEGLIERGVPEELLLLREADVLVDGRFVLEQRTVMLPFRGSTNQRLIDVDASLAAGRVVEKAVG